MRILDPSLPSSVAKYAFLALLLSLLSSVKVKSVSVKKLSNCPFQFFQRTRGSPGWSRNVGGSGICRHCAILVQVDMFVIKSFINTSLLTLVRHTWIVYIRGGQPAALLV